MVPYAFTFTLDTNLQVIKSSQNRIVIGGIRVKLGQGLYH
jgi:hypothetical protein